MVLTTQHVELLRGIEQEDFMAMELEDLERISKFCDNAFTTRKKQRIEELEKYELLEFEPKTQELFTSKPNSIGRWEPKLDPVDGSVFIDRDPTMFGMILNYLRTGTIALDHLSPMQLSQLKTEVDFYQIGSHCFH